MRRRRTQHQHARGVTSILAMMFMVLFGSLAFAMAVVAQGNLRTAEASLKVSRAMSAAESGLVFASRRLQSEASRFVVEKGVIDANFASDIWLGTYDTSSDGSVQILPPKGYITTGSPGGLLEALLDAHLADDHSIIVEPGDSSLPAINTTFGTMLARPIALASEANTPYFRLKYELLSDVPMIRVTSQGVDGDITRTLQLDFRIDKRIEYAVISPNRIMIGKNVRVEGPLGSRYGLFSGELDSAHGHPIIMRSDFYFLDSTLDATLDLFFQQVIDFDVDGDGRLRPNHPVEALGLQGHSDLVDYTGDGYVTDFDLFMAYFDANGDKMVVYDPSLAAEVGHGTLAAEFSGIDDQLARLIDLAFPDRDGDGDITSSDRLLGYRDGVIDARDYYAKVTGRLMFAVEREDWEAALGGASYQTEVHGPVHAGIDNAPVSFGMDDEILREIDTSMFVGSQNWFDNQTSSSQSFEDQVASNLGSGGTFTSGAVAGWEAVPYGSPGAYDYYQRPIYSNMTFTNVRIPKGTNALFEDCIFIGVTYIETQIDVDHHNWNYAGSVEPVDFGGVTIYEERFPGMASESDGETIFDTRVESNNIRFHNCTFLGSLAGDTPNQYTHWRNKIQMTGEIRFYIDTEDEDLLQQSDASTLISHLEGLSASEIEELTKSSIMLPGWSVDVGNFSNEVDSDYTLTPRIKLKGLIIAGILDVRGTADVHGTLMMTFRAVPDDGPLFYGGQPDAFNTTIGYFGPLDGDGEGTHPADSDFEGFGEITLRYDPNAKLPDGIPWPIRVDAVDLSYVEGGGM